MSATLVIVRAGIHTTVQDAGRPGYRALGVPVSGALDPVALQLVNAVVGNAPTIGALEMLYSGITFEVSGGSARIAVAGTDALIHHLDGSTTPLATWRSVTLAPGERVRVGTPGKTAAAYVAVEAGFAIPRVLGSVATLVQGGLGGFKGRALLDGDVLPLAASHAQPRDELTFAARPIVEQPALLRVMPGPQHDAFSSRAYERLFNERYIVTPASNRTGLRLTGAPLEHSAGHDLLSEGVATGSVQVPGSGQPVLLVGDHPTVGGYPKIATVISADLAAAGRLRIGAAVRFSLVDETQARYAREEQAMRLRDQLASLRPVTD